MKFENDGWSTNHRSTADTLVFIPADQNIRPLRDQIVIEPLDVVRSRYIEVADYKDRPIRGRVLAAGPGCYVIGYDHPDKHKRKKRWETKKFRPCQVKVGDIVQFGAFPFEQYQWGDKRVLICREEDITGVEDPAGLDTRGAA